ncbi:beta strand repeat-containing protein [Arthrobacter sp. HLT1-20]
MSSPALPSATSTTRKPRLVPVTRRLCLLILVIGAALSLSTAAWAFWTTTGDGGATAATGTLNAPSGVTASAPQNSSTVTVGWAGAQLATGQAATGYYVLRLRDSDGASFPACDTTLTSPTTALNCSDLDVTDGAYHYRVTALFGSWTSLSPPGNSVTVVNDSSRPSINVTSITPTPNGNGYNNTSPVTVNLAASGGFAIDSITYTVDSALPVTVPGATAAVSVSGDGIHLVTYYAKDVLGRASETGSVFARIDRAAPAAPAAPVLSAASDTGASSTDRITKITAPTVTGTAEGGSTVTLYDGTTAVGAATADGGAYTIISGPLANGTRTLTTRATDLAGNVSPASAATTVTIDTSAPSPATAPVLTAASDSGSSATDRITNVTTPTFTGTAEAESTLTVYNGSTATGTATATAGGAYTATSSTLTGGTKTMTVRATDIAGNTSATSPSTSITIDITAPGKPGRPTLTAASDTGRSATDSITKIITPTITGTATAGTTVTLYDGAAAIGTAPVAGGYTITTTLANGSHAITAKATDIAGNVSIASTARTVTIDTTAPPAPPAPKLSAASDTGKSSSDRITKTTTPIMTGTNESRAIVTLYDGATQIGSRTTTGTTFSIASLALAAGVHTLTATATDTAGNTGTSSPSTTITIDTTAPGAPAAPVLTAASDTGISTSDRLTKTTTPALTGTAEDGSTIALFDGATATGAAVTATASTYTATTGTLTTGDHTLTTGDHTLTAAATDPAGNTGPSSPGTGITIDTTAPAVTINQGAEQADPTTAATINFTVVSNENLHGLSGSGITFTGTAGATTAAVTGTGTGFNIAVSGMTKTGTVIPKVNAGAAQDAAGNPVTASTTTDNTVSYTDNIAPAVSINTFTPEPSRTAALAGNAGYSPGHSTTVTVVLCTVNAFPCAGGNIKATLTPAINPSTGAWSAATGALGPTPVLYARATQTDLTTNTGQSPVAGPITIP